MTSIFVAKLDFNTTDEQLKSLFEEHGRVNRVTIAKDRETGKPRGFAFVEMADESEADQAIKALDNYSINGRNIAVKKADDRASGGKPSGGDNRSGDRPPFKSDRPREDRSNTNDYKSDYKKPEDNRGSKPAFTSSDEIVQPKVDRTKKDKDLKSGVNKDAPKKNKMEAYRKSGKDNQFLNDDDLSDEELDLFGRDSEEDDDDYRKYLVNSDEDSDEDYDDEDWDDEEDDNEEE
ncbi:RNA recognition motif [compost metagenome]